MSQEPPAEYQERLKRIIERNKAWHEAHPEAEGSAEADRRRHYKRDKQREYEDRRVAKLIAEGKKPCNGPLCNGAVKSFDEFYPKPGTRLGITSRCKDCKNAARKDRYHDPAKVDQERARSRGTAQGIRDKAIAIYGGQCELCGNTHDLEFDHVNWDGGEHRKVENASSMKRRIATTGQRLADYELRLVCGPCHRGLRPKWSRRMLALHIAGSNNWPVTP